MPTTYANRMAAFAFTALAAIVLLARPAQAQMHTDAQGGFTCDACGSMDRGSGMEHSFWNLVGCTGGGNCMDCNAYNSCHGNWQTGECSAWHWECGTSAMLFKAAQEYASTGVQPAWYTHGSGSTAGTLILNVDRGVVQVKNCQGAVVAQFHLAKPGLKTPVLAAHALGHIGSRAI